VSVSLVDLVENERAKELLKESEEHMAGARAGEPGPFHGEAEQLRIGRLAARSLAVLPPPRFRFHKITCPYTASRKSGSDFRRNISHRIARITPRAHRSLPRAPRPLPYDRPSEPRAGPSRGLRGHAPHRAKVVHFYAPTWPVFTPPLTVFPLQHRERPYMTMPSRHTMRCA